MKKEEMTMPDMLLEAIGIVAIAAYGGLQIYYGILYTESNAIMQIIMNLLVLILVYLGLTLLQFYPERVNHLTREACIGKMRRYTIVMARYEKLIFAISLLFTSVCDILGLKLHKGGSWAVGILMVAVAVYFESKIIRLIKEKIEK